MRGSLWRIWLWQSWGPRGSVRATSSGIYLAHPGIGGMQTLDLMTLQLPVRNPKTKDIEYRKWQFLPPRHVAIAIWPGSPAFFLHVPCTKGGLSLLWEGMAKADWAAKLPAVLDGPGQRWRIGYRIHGDGFQCYKNSKCFALQWKATSAKGGPYTSRNLFTLIPCHFMVKTRDHNTLLSAVEHMCRMFNLMHEGLGPEVDALPPGIALAPGSSQAEAIAGQRFAGPWLWAFCGVSGDLEFKRDVHNCQKMGQYYAKSEFACSKCMASRRAKLPESDGMHADNFRDDATWPQTCLTTQQYLALADAKRARTPFAELVGWAHPLDLDDDLHMLYLGAVPELVGSAVVFLAERKWWGQGGLETNLKKGREVPCKWPLDQHFDH